MTPGSLCSDTNSLKDTSTLRTAPRPPYTVTKANMPEPPTSLRAIITTTRWLFAHNLRTLFAPSNSLVTVSTADLVTPAQFNANSSLRSMVSSSNGNWPSKSNSPTPTSTQTQRQPSGSPVPPSMLILINAEPPHCRYGLPRWRCSLDLQVVRTAVSDRIPS